ncbi:MAG TPA: amidohydrolase family protein [Actinomycetota bacterium]|nr:amidohydrolase family protein [Actinomycetota bacterium]
MTIVRAALVLAEDRWRRHHAFAMQGGRILATGTPEELAASLPDHDVQDWGNVAVVPGCVNGHAHSFQVLLRGLGDDLPFARWRDRVLYPFSERLDRDAIRAGALFDFAEMARAGITTTVDFFYLHDRGNENDLAVVEAAREVGVRLVLARSMYDWSGAPRRYLETPAEAVQRFRELHQALRGDATAFAQPAPHSIHGASPDMIRAGADLAAELDLPFHIHVAEGRYERDASLERHGLSPVRFLDALGVLSERTVMVHCVWVDEDDLQVMAERGVRVVHNPSANAFLGDGIAPFRDMVARGIPVCLGTDGGCTNSRQSIFEEMRMAALLAKAVRADGGAVTAEQVLLAGTARGGEVLGLPVGRIAADHAADLVVLDLDALSLQPAATAEKQVVYAMQPGAIRRVLVGGEPIVEDGRLLRVDEAEIRARVAAVTADWSAVD